MDSCLSHDDAHVVSGSEDGRICFWDLVEVSNKLLEKLQLLPAAVLMSDCVCRESWCTALVTQSRDDEGRRVRTVWCTLWRSTTRSHVCSQLALTAPSASGRDKAGLRKTRRWTPDQLPVPVLFQSVPLSIPFPVYYHHRSLIQCTDMQYQYCATY